MHRESLTILVDYRERAPAIDRRLSDLGAATERCNLPVADYVVAGGIGVERKTIADLHRSIGDRRIWVQVASLRTDFSRAFLIVEGRTPYKGRISPNGARAALLAIGDLGVRVIRADDELDTAGWLWALARRYGRDAPCRVARSRPRGRDTPTSMLETVPGISPVLAKVLLGRFGSIAAVATATSEELMNVPGIGRQRAINLQRAFTSDGAS